MRDDTYIREAFGLAFPGGYRAARLIMVFTVYLDESGTHPGASALAVAGYLSTQEAWERFEVSWRKALEHYEIPFFHMTDFNAGRQHFADWPRDKKAYRLRRLIQTINQHVLVSIGCVLSMDAYARLSPAARHGCGGPYCLATMCVIAELSAIVRKAYPDGEIAYVCEAGASGRGEMLKTFTANLKNEAARKKYHLLSIRFENKRQFLPLQAADILAWELYQELPKQLGQSTRRSRKEILSQLKQVPHAHWVHLSEPQLRNYAKALTEIGLAS